MMNFKKVVLATILTGLSLNVAAIEVTTEVCGIKVQYDSTNTLSFGETGELDTDPRITANKLAHEANTGEGSCMDTSGWPAGTTPFYDECVRPTYYIAKTLDSRYSVDEEEGDVLILTTIGNSEYVSAKTIFRDANNGETGLIAIQKGRKCTK